MLLLRCLPISVGLQTAGIPPPDHPDNPTHSQPQVPVNGAHSNSSSSHASSSNGSSSSSSETLQQQLPVASTSSPSPAAAAGTAAAATPAAATAGGARAESAGDESTSRGLHQEFLECTCFQDVLDIIGDEFGVMSPHNTTTAFSCLYKLSKPVPKATVRAQIGTRPFALLLSLLERQSAQMSPFQVVNSLYYCAQLVGPGLKNMPRLLPAVEGALMRCVGQLNDRDVGNVLHAYASMQQQPQGEFLGVLCSRAQSLLSQGGCSAQTVSMMLWALGTLGVKVNNNATAAAAAAALRSEAVFKELTSQGLANSVWALAKLNLTDIDLMKRAMESVKKRGKGFRLQELLNILWAAAAMRYHPGAAMLAFISCCTERAKVSRRVASSWG